MKRLVLLMISVLFMATGTADAVELLYTWNKGDVHRFAYEDLSTVSMPMPGGGGGGMPGMPAGMPDEPDMPDDPLMGDDMGDDPGMPPGIPGGIGIPGGVGIPGMGGGEMKITVATKSVFSQKVLSVNPDGSAKVELTIEKMEFSMGGGSMTVLDQIPPQARKMTATVDRKGKMIFEKMVTAYFEEGQVYVGVRPVKGGLAASGGARGPDGEEVRVDVVAAINPETGEITASAKVTEKPAKLKKAKVKQESPAMDVLPTRLFEMLVLPDGDVAPGTETTVKLPMMAVKVGVSELEDGATNIRTRSAAGMSDDNESGVGAKMTADIKTRFNVEDGFLVSTGGTVDTAMSIPGMGEMKVSAKLSLKRID